MTPPIAVYDACVLYPFHLRNVLVQCAVDRLVTARWTEAIHDEWIRNLVANTAGLTRERLDATRELMNRVLPDATVTGYEHLLPELADSIADPDDRHVLAAAIRSRAAVIVTDDKHFRRADRIAAYGISVVRPDSFLLGLYESDRTLLLASLARARMNLSRRAASAEAFVEGLRRTGVLDGLSALLGREHLQDL